VPDYTQNLNDSIQGLTIGLPKEFFAEGLDDGVAKKRTPSILDRLDEHSHGATM
jgi:hypothetical protein